MVQIYDQVGASIYDQQERPTISVEEEGWHRFVIKQEHQFFIKKKDH